MESLRNPFQVVPEPVSHQERFSSHALNEVLQCVQLPVMDGDHLPGICVYRTVRHLGELPGEGCGIGGVNLPIRELQQQIPLEGNIPLHFLLREIHLIAGGNEPWHLQVIRRFHRNRNVGDQPVYLLLCPWKGLVGKHHLPVALVRQEKPGTVLADKPPKPLSHVQQAELCPKIHQAVAAGRPGQPYNPAYLRPHLHHGTEPLGLVVLERR